MQNSDSIKKAYEIAKQQYKQLGIDTDEALEQMKNLQISMHCWQADDVGGFETPESELEGGGIQVTGNYPGKARTLDEVRQDLDKAMSLLPGKQKINIHAIYGDFGGKLVDRDQIDVQHFQRWIDWAKERGIGIDFNCTCFSHPKADGGFTISSKNEEIRKFWVQHIKQCRKIAASIGEQTGIPSVHNIWVPDGSKDIPVDRFTHRALLKKSLDEIFSVDYPNEHLKDSIESKLFGIGAEAMTVGSYDFYLPYAAKNDKLICLDNGHYHPTEEVGDKISSVLLYIDEIMLHVTRGVRWDSDHVVTLNDDVRSIAQEIIRAKALNRVNVGLDFFDGSINRIGAYVIGTRAAQQAFLYALLEPTDKMRQYEENENYFERLALLELMKTKPFGAVWDYYCLMNDVPVSEDYIADIQQYEKDVLSKR
jgi:L-rhamnose isomerase